jgi:serine/threonine protein kinase
MTNLVGKTLKNQYFLRELAGAGGMADVYQAWDTMRSTRMAIKVLRRDLATSPRFFKMFAKEAEVLRKLEHPNIVRLYSFENEDDIIFIVMDWVQGGNLRQAIQERQRPFKLDEVSHILEPVCSALHYAHQSNVYHCDVKPANILLHEDGRVLLTDFGVARLAYEREGGGTPPYMAPEQFAGGQVDARTDVYALGITLYEILSGGQVPFRGDSKNTPGQTTREKIAWEHQNLSLPPILQFNPSLPEGVFTVVETALNKDPELRYPTPMAMREAFEHARMRPRQKASSTPTLLHPVQLPIKQPVSKPVLTQAITTGKHLYCRSGELARHNIPITRLGITIGRGVNNQVRLQERSVSRTHVSILWTKRGIYIRDEQSSLGTMINGQRITANIPILLHHGDVIQIGYYQIFEFREK